MTHAHQHYTPPESLAPPPESALAQYPDAGLGRRFSNLLVDNIVYQFAGIPVFAVSEIVSHGSTQSIGWSLALSVGTFLAYYAGFERWLGRTPGKLVTGTRVTRADGEPLTFRSILLRTLIRFVPFEPFSFLAGIEPRGWHDQWSSTRVVYTRGGPEELQIPR